MALPDYKALLTRAKKMAGNLGRVPSAGDIIQRFHQKGVELNMEMARKLEKDVKSHRGESGTSQRRSRSSGPVASSQQGQSEPEQEEKPVERKPEAERAPVREKSSANYGYSRRR